MAEQKRFYWLKLRKDFFQSQQIRILEGMPNGKEYAYFLLKLMAESISAEGKLRLTDTIPYSEEMLAALTNTNVDIVRAAVQAFQVLGLVQIMDDGTYYMTEVEKMIGEESEWAEKKRLFREKRKELGQSKDNVLEMSSDAKDNVQDNEDNVLDAVGQSPIRDKSIEIRDKSIEIKKDIRKKDRQAVITYLNEKLGTSYSSEGKAIERLVNGRFNEGYTVEDFVKVIDNMTAEWLGDPKMEQYLRPSTLFAPTHFPEYLNRKPKAKKQSYFGEMFGEDDDFDLDFLTK